jgi:thiol-disulfide isomerase/thioredoxin
MDTSSGHFKMFLKPCAIALFILAVWTAPLRADDFASHFVAVTPPQALPPFLFEDGKGQLLRLADFHGHPVLLNLWASWCGPCVEEMPSLDALQSAFRSKGLAVIALSEDRGEDVAAVFFKRHGIRNLPIYADPSGRVPSVLHAHGLPMSFLIDAQGQEIGYVEGGVDWSSPDTMAAIRSRLLTRPSIAY